METDTDEFECIANYLRDNKLLEKNFKYYTQDEDLECETFMSDIKDVMLNKTIRAMIQADDSSEEPDETTNDFREMYSTNPVCFHEQLKVLNYPELIMQTFIYTRSRKLSSKLKKQYLAALEADNIKKIVIASSNCFPEALFGAAFDKIFANTTEEDEPLDDKQTDYCIRKFVVDNNLIDTSIYTVELNPDKLENLSDLDCTEFVEDAFEELRDSLRNSFLTDNMQLKSKKRCMNRAIRKANSVSYMSRLSVLSELKLNDESKSVEKDQFIKFMGDLYGDLTKCL